MRPDWERIYEIVKERDREINSYFQKLPPELEQEFRNILEGLGLSPTEERFLMLKKRFLHLREESLQLLFQQAKLTPPEVHRWQLEIYDRVKEFWLVWHRQLVEELKPHLTPFYRQLVEGVHRLGVLFSQWQPVWTSHLLHTINPELELQFGGDEAKILAFLQEEGLLDLGHFQEVGDRCYSVLVKEGGKYRVASYREFFRREVEEAIGILERLISELEGIPASEEEQKPQWLHYLSGLKGALEEEVVENLIPRWAEVDRRWMEVTTPLQLGHPLEYYEDKYRKAVALELDLRIQHPTLTSSVRPKIERLYRQLCTDPSLLEVGLQNLRRVQLYISTPALFYGAELNGLFSAQVVPNDEVVSQEKGKKIFAFVEKVYNDLKARPRMRLGYEIFGEEFLERFYRNLEDWNLFFKLYDITTIGHEFGHILWVDADTESKMNRSGMYKNGEEWKATTGGLVAFFLEEEPELAPMVLEDLIHRSVSLISWMEVPEVLPYYIEGLIHLTALFETSLLSFNGRQLQYNFSAYPELKKWYLEKYRKLGELYTKKGDSWEFLKGFIRKKGGNYYPINRE
ncbi:MAG: invasion protein CiaB, partial [Campylobacterales bacterium]